LAQALFTSSKGLETETLLQKPSGSGQCGYLRRASGQMMWLRTLSFGSAATVLAHGANNGFECLFFEQDGRATYADNDIPSNLAEIYIEHLTTTPVSALSREAKVQVCENTCKDWGAQCTAIGCNQPMTEEKCGKEKHEDGTMAVAYKRCSQACGGFYLFDDGSTVPRCQFRAIGLKQMAGANAGTDGFFHRCMFARANVHCPPDECKDGNNEGTLNPFTSTRWSTPKGCSQYVEEGVCDAEAKECNHRTEASVCNFDNEGHGQADQKCCACGGGSSGWGLFLETAGDYMDAGDECNVNDPVQDTVSEGTCDSYAADVANPQFCVPGSEKIGRGFNVLTEELKQRVVGLKYSQNANIVLGSMSADGRVVFVKADQIDISDKTMSASSVASTTKIESMQDYYRGRSVSVGGVASVGGMSVGAKASASRTVSTSLKQGKTLFTSRKTATFLTARLTAGSNAKPCSAGFQAELAKLASANAAGTFDQGTYNSLYKPLIDAFGTHFVYGGKMGGMVQEDRFESSCSKATTESIKTEFEGSVAPKVAPVSGQGGVSQDTGNTQSSSASVKRESMKVEGGKTTDFTSEGWEKYQDTLLKNYPALVEFELRPIWKLASGTQRKALHKALAKYLKDELEGMEQNADQLNQLCAIAKEDACAGFGDVNSAPSLRGKLAMPLAVVAAAATALLSLC